jgi:hypothetical protein
MTRSVSRISVARLPRVGARPALGRNVVAGSRARRFAGQLGVCLLCSAAPVLAVARFGVTLTLFTALFAVAAAIAAASPVAYAFIVLAVAPLPDAGTLVGVSVPPGFDPLTLLVALGAILAVHSGVSFPYRNAPGLVWLTGLSLVLLAISWMRTYGQDAIDGTTIALLLKPAIVVAAGVLVVLLLPRARVEQTLGLAMGGALLVIGASVALQRLGVYTSAAQLANADRLQLKQYGGLMISGNDAGAVVAAFTIPAYVLLRSAGYRGFGLCVLLASFPIMLITLARGSLVALMCSLAALAVLDRRAVRGARTVVGVLVVGVVWTLTVGRGQADILLTSLQSTSGDTNATLSGRSVIWDEVPVFLDQGHQRWLFGGGLDSFRAHTEAALGNAFATHSAYFAFLTNGGMLMLVTAVALLVALWHVAGRGRDSMRLALRTALVAVAVMGLSANVDVFTLAIAWIWPLAMAAMVLRDEAPEPTSPGGRR